MSADKILDECKATLFLRGKNYGDFDQGMEYFSRNIAGLTGIKHDPVIATAFLFALKITRMAESNMQHRDSCMDALNYLAEYIHLMDKAEGWDQ